MDNISHFNSGDILSINLYKSLEKDTALYSIKGLCISKKRQDVDSSFTIRTVVQGEALEVTYMMRSPFIHSIAVLGTRKKRSSKLYYLRHKMKANKKYYSKI